MVRIALVTLIVALTPGCFERPLEPADPCTRTTYGFIMNDGPPDKVDLLLVIDDSSAMAPVLPTVLAEIPRAILMLTSGDRDGDGSQDFTPVRSLHVGIVTTDMGAGDVSGLASCDPGFGDDGLMQIRTRGSAAACMASYDALYAATPNVFDFEAHGGVPLQIATDVGCVAALGAGGCDFPQGLEAALKAISLAPSPSGGSPVAWTAAGYQPPIFFGPTFGHGNDFGTNGAFLRPDSVLAIVVIGDHDDCSTTDPHIFSPDDPAFVSADLALRCHTFASELQPISRYVDGFTRLHANPALVVYSAITGIPMELSGYRPAEILESPRMQERVDPAMPHQLVPACASSDGRVTAPPGVRMTQLAQQMDAVGATVSVHSICNPSFEGAFDGIVQSISEAIAGGCLARGLDPDGNGFIDCDVFEVLPSGMRCAELSRPEAFALDHVETNTFTDGTMLSREVCRVRQVGRAGAGIEPGWAYDDGDPRLLAGWSDLPLACSQRIGLSEIDAIFGAEVYVACDETLIESNGAPVALGTRCDPATGVTPDAHMCAEGAAIANNPVHLSCDRFRSSCQIACTQDSDCARAGLPSYQCDLRTALMYFTQIPDGVAPTDTHGFCARPTCEGETFR